MEKERACLKCGKKFLSKSIGNRICSNCKGTKGPPPTGISSKDAQQTLKEKTVKTDWRKRFIHPESYDRR